LDRTARIVLAAVLGAQGCSDRLVGDDAAGDGDHGGTSATTETMGNDGTSRGTMSSDVGDPDGTTVHTSTDNTSDSPVDPTSETSAGSTSETSAGSTSEASAGSTSDEPVSSTGTPVDPTTGGSVGSTSDDPTDPTTGDVPADGPVLELTFSQIKQFDFSWAPFEGADYYQLLESASLGEPYVQLGGDVVGESISFTMPLHFRFEASYVLRACHDLGCTDSAPLDVTSSLAEATGYFKASNTSASDHFGVDLALSGDGSTLVVGAGQEDSNATGVDGDQTNDLADRAGAVYVFVRDAGDQWSQQAYLKASNTDPIDFFGYTVAVSDDGATIAVTSVTEDSDATGIDGDESSDLDEESGAVYVFVRDLAGQWSQQAYVKASNTDPNDHFGCDVALSGDGNTLAVGADEEDSSATGIDGDASSDLAGQAGAVYVFARDLAGQWSQQAYVKASNAFMGQRFGTSLALSDDGETLAVGARGESSSATGVGGDQAPSLLTNSGAVYVFVRDPLEQWSQQAYIKASNTDANDSFGAAVALSSDGDTLAVGADEEDSSATGIDGDPADNSAVAAGAVYVLVRDAGGQWSHQAYVKASNTDVNDRFGNAVALSADGDVLVVGAHLERSNAPGIGGDQADDSLVGAGAVYVLVRDAAEQWSHRAYVKPPIAFSGEFGTSVALSSNADLLVIGAPNEDSNAIGIGGNQNNFLFLNSGAVYLF